MCSQGWRGCVKGSRALCDVSGGYGHLGSCQLGGWDTPARSSPFFSSFFMSRSFSTLWGSLSHSCMRTKGSRPFKLSLCQGLGLDSRSDTEPCVSPRMLSPNNRCPGDRAEGSCHPRPRETHSQDRKVRGAGREGGPSALSAQETGEGRNWTATQKLLSLHSQVSTPANCQETPCPVVSRPPTPKATLVDSV